MEIWNLDALYKGFDDETFTADFAALEKHIQAANDFAKTLVDTQDARQKLCDIVRLASALHATGLKLQAYTGLRLATAALDEEANGVMNRLQQAMSQTSAFQTAISKFVPKIDGLSDIIAGDETLKPYRFYFERIKELAQYVLSDKEEAIIAKMRMNGSSAWGRLQGLLTSIVKVDLDGEEITLPAVRNKAYVPDAETRKEAYEAELESYKKIEHSLAAALNGVKGEVNELSTLRGFKSPLEEAVTHSRMSMSTLEALIASMEKHLPMFRQYLRRKAELLGHGGALPWYDLFAPLGRSERTFTSAEAMQYIAKNFETFGEDLANLALRAHDEQWIDYTPRSGKRGGAFCMNIHPIGQSRILTNFDGSFANVITLAHELGHAYHGDRIFQEPILNSSYTMPVAETASTLCETIVKKAALKDSRGDEHLFILEQSLMGSTQVIVDIMSRYLFEQAVFKTRQKTPLSPVKYCAMMKDAQRKTYGDALDENAMHPYMWANKGHYYSGGLSFYNFPYAFGLLFAKGIYAMFQEKGAAFANDVDRLLTMTGQMNVEDVAALIDIDVGDVAFWDRSLDVIREEIERFLDITAK